MIRLHRVQQYRRDVWVCIDTPSVLGYRQDRIALRGKFNVTLPDRLAHRLVFSWGTGWPFLQQCR